MENYFLKKREDDYLYPEIDLNATTGVCVLTGESYLENPEEYYAPVLGWVKEFADKKSSPLHFKFKLTYFNTSSSRCILELLELIKKYQDKGGEVQVSWHCDPDDIDMVEDVEDFVTGTGLDIEIVEEKA